VSTLSAAAPGARVALATERPLAKWGPLAALLVLGAALRLSTLGLQSFWYDEAFTPVHVLHHGLAATMRSVAHTENSPPLWYLVAWLDVRVLGDGAVALRLPSALAGIGTIAVAWPIGEELGGRLCALVSAALVAVNPLFFWYSQEARTYALFVLASALSLLFFLRARRLRTGRTMAAFALSGALALLTHYFAVFLVVPMAALLVAERATRRAALAAVAALACVGGALVPLLAAQGGHGTQWIGRWALSSRLQAIPQYYLTGYSGAPLGHGIELLIALPILAGVALGARRLLLSPEAQAARLVAALAAVAILAPILLAAVGADYLAPRNLVGAMVPLTAVVAYLFVPGAGRAGFALAAVLAAGFLAMCVDVDLSPRLQRGNWRGLARELVAGRRSAAITTVELGGAPLQYYLPDLSVLPRHSRVAVAEIDETGYSPLRPSAGRAPAPGFSLRARGSVDGLVFYRFVSPVARTLSQARLRGHVITRARPVVLVGRAAHVTSAPARG
jgi:mannosyltransferase